MIDISPVIPGPFAPLFAPNVSKIVEASGRSSGKTTTNESAAVVRMLESRLNNIWYCRAEKTDIRGTIFASMCSTIQALGAERLFKFSLSPLEITCRITGAKCYFSGINGKTPDDVNATKGFTPQDKSLAMFILDEANEAKASTHVEAAESTAIKFLKNDGKIVYAYNPPPVRTHWAHTFFKNQSAEPGAVNVYTTWQDVAKLLKPRTIEKIKTMRDNDPRHYEYWYLGQCVSLEGLVLYTFDRMRNLMTLETFLNRVRMGIVPVYMIYGVDSGVVKDATAVSAWAVMSDGIMLKMSTFYFEPKKHSDEPVPNSLQVEFIKTWYDGFYNKFLGMGVPLPTSAREVWVFDNAVVTQDLMAEWQRKTGFFCKAVEKKNIERDIKRLQNGYYTGFLQVLDTPENQPALDEIDGFVYDENNEIPDGQNDHTIDADKYATSFYYYQYLLG